MDFNVLSQVFASVGDRHHDFSAVVHCPGVASLERLIRSSTITTPNQLGDWMNVVYAVAERLSPDDQLAVVTHCGRLIDDQADATQAGAAT